MRPYQSDYEAVLIKQQSATNAATLTSDNLDCKGFKYAKLTIHSTTSDAATNNVSVLKLQESDTTAATDFADITAFVGDGTGGFTIPNAATATQTLPICRMCVDLRKRKRYLRVLISPVTTQTFTVLASLTRAEEEPNTDAERNVDVSVIG